MSEWISVKEKLPPKDGTMFIVANFKNRPAWKAVAWFGSVHNNWLYTGRTAFFIEHQTHWMNIPDNPEDYERNQ